MFGGAAWLHGLCDVGAFRWEPMRVWADGEDVVWCFKVILGTVCTTVVESDIFCGDWSGGGVGLDYLGAGTKVNVGWDMWIGLIWSHLIEGAIYKGSHLSVASTVCYYCCLVICYQCGLKCP
jgi:hypothetical protein